MTGSASAFAEALIQAGPLKLLGGRGVLVTPARAKSHAQGSEAGFVRSFRFKYAAVENLGRFLVEPPQRLMRVIRVNERTAQRRRESGALSPEESDRIARIARVSQLAIDALGDAARAREWLKRPNRALQDAAPLDLLSTDAGARLVADELGRIEYGDLY